jgi:hypothetical protein
MKLRSTFGSPLNPAHPRVIAVLVAAARAGRAKAWLRPGFGSPDGRIDHDDGVAVDALVACGERRTPWLDAPLPWHLHPLFRIARAAGKRAAERAERAAQEERAAAATLARWEASEREALNIHGDY